MNRNGKSIISIAFVLILILSLTAPAFAASAITTQTNTVPVFLNNSKGNVGYWGFNLAWGTKDFTIKRDSVKVSGSGARLAELCKNNSTSQNNFIENGTWKTSKSVNCSYNITLRLTKTGTATVKYTIGSKEYTTKVKILQYENPVKSITLTGVNNSNSFASLTKTQFKPSKDLKLIANTKSAKLKITPASGWKIGSAEIYDITTGNYRVIGNGKGMASATLSCGTLNAAHNYSVNIVYLKPDANGAARVNISYYIKGAKAS